MDVELARTFLQIVNMGSFVKAAEQLNLTQSTISMRVKSLEDQLGRPVFIRSKAGITLTPAGLQFQRFAFTIVQAWEQARHQIAVPSGYTYSLAIGSQYSLGDKLMYDWLPWMRREAPNVALRAEFSITETLMQNLMTGILDMAIMYRPQMRPGLELELLMEESLVLVSDKVLAEGDPGDNYVYVDWGVEFQESHSLQFPDFFIPGLVVGNAALGLEYIKRSGGAGYFPIRMVRPLIEKGLLHRVAWAQAYLYPVYLLYRHGLDEQTRDTAIAGLRHIAGRETEAARTDA